MELVPKPEPQRACCLALPPTSEATRRQTGRRTSLGAESVGSLTLEIKPPGLRNRLLLFMSPSLCLLP